MSTNSIKLYRTLSTLNPKELDKFGRFVHSPYFHTHAETISFFDLIRDEYPDFSSPKISPQNLFSAIYPGENFDDNKIRTLRKYLLELLYRFLAQERQNSDENVFYRALLFELLERKLEDDFPRVHQQSIDTLDETPIRDEQYYYNWFFLERLQLHFDIQTRNRLENKPYDQIMLPLNHSFIIQKLNYACSKVNQEKARGIVTTPSLFLGTVLKHCQENFDSIPILAKAYFLCHQLLDETETEETLSTLQNILYKHHLSIGDIHLQNIFGYAINYCNRRYRKGDTQFLTTMFQLYQKMLMLNLLFEKGKLSTHQYKNLTTLGLRVGEIEWTRNFILHYKDRLPSEYREGVYHYNLAHLYSYEGTYREALKQLREVTFIDPYYRISYQMLMMKIYYECIEIEPLLSLVQSFRANIRRNNALPENQKQVYNNFARFLKALFMIKIGKKPRKKTLPNQIDSCKALIEKDWLLDKAGQLLSGTQTSL
ncbi:MAG: hypothetical protein SF052_08910 [Bacteroidia bacterium]|nr:hypothetical protein [Bacteroidia bacterium]